MAQDKVVRDSIDLHRPLCFLTNTEGEVDAGCRSGWEAREPLWVPRKGGLGLGDLLGQSIPSLKML